MTSNLNSSPGAADIAYLRFKAPDLDVMRTFLEDFGLIVTASQTPSGVPALYSRGTDATPYLHVVEEGEAQFVGVGFRMESAEDLKKLSEMEGASGIEQVQERGGGERVRFTDPHGYEIDGVYGWEVGEAMPPAQRVPINSGENRARRGVPVRLQAGPSRVKRLGHCVLYVEDFRTSEAWYKSRFGFITSDEIYAEHESNVVGAFMRCDRGEIPVDHHTVFLLQFGENRGLQHAAFEVHDWDDVMLGHTHLKSKDYTPNWGIGKHILGSQVFDYWNDPYGNNLEHFSDGDLFDSSVQPSLSSVEVLRSAQWGPSIHD
ncbi:MAG: VOC family protein [Pseudomonadota bacterium]